MRERQFTNPLEPLTRIMSDAGTPGADGISDEVLAHMDRLVAAADEAYDRLQAQDTDAFLRQSRQLGGQ